MHRHRGRVPFVPSLGLGVGYLALLGLEWLARSVPADAPWSARRAADWDGETVETWARRNVRSISGRQVIAMVCEAVWAADPADVSLLHLLAYANAARGINRLIETAGGAQEARVIGGSQRIALALADALADRVVLTQPVREIEHNAEGVTLRCPGLVVHARRAIIATSPALAGRIAYSPNLGSDRDQLTQRTPNGSVIKCLAVYEEPFWRQRGLSGQVTSTTGPVKVVFDNSPPDGKPGVLLAFLEGRHARTLARRAAAERRQTVLGCLTKFFGSHAAAPREYIEKDWSEDPWTRGCYGAFFPPNTWTSYGHALRASVGRLHWAGAETATVWMGYMDGAIRSGERAASEVLAVEAP
jgi:monoamine oxidase